MWIVSRIIAWRMRRMVFGEQPLALKVIEPFLLGADHGLRGRDQAALQDEAGIPWTHRPFYWEGFAFGASGRCALTRGRRPELPVSGFRFMFFTGLGFWNGLAQSYWLPQVSLRGEQWIDTPDFEGSRFVIAGGLGFARVTLAKRVDPEGLSALFSGSQGTWRRGLYQGAGRAAWFLHMQDGPALTALLAALGEDGVPVAEGLGLALTYTQLSAPDGIPQMLARLPASLGQSLRAGVTLCLGIVSSDDPRTDPALAALPTQLRDWSAQGAEVLRRVGRGPDLPERLLEHFAHDLATEGV